MKNYSFLTFAFICFLAFSGFSQIINPSDNNLFDSKSVHRIDVTMNADSLDWLFEPQNLYKDEYKRANFTFTDANTGAVTTVNDVGIRLRGNTSRQADKKSFKIQFDEFVNGQELDGVDEINLKGSHNDPTLLREALSYHLMDKMGLPASRTAHVQLYINGTYRGLYANIEHYDKRFLESRFGNRDGNFYKCSYGATLKDDNDAYDNVLFELKTNATINNRAKLEELIDVLNYSPLGTFREDLMGILNVDGLMRYLAVETITGHWDGYSYNMNNFYLYYNTAIQKFEFIPYDPDNTFGIDWVNRDWGNRNIYGFFRTGAERPLVTRLLDTKEFHIMYSEFVNQLISEFFNEGYLFPKIDSLKTLIRPFVASDSYYALDYGFTMSDFDNSFTQSLGGHVSYGLKPYISTRKSSALNQLDQVALYNQEYVTAENLKVLNIGDAVFVNGTSQVFGEVYQVYNMAGQLVFKGALKINPERLNLKSGVYILSLPEIQVTQKIVVP